jgi:hypothetical protein
MEFGSDIAAKGGRLTTKDKTTLAQVRRCHGRFDCGARLSLARTICACTHCTVVYVQRAAHVCVGPCHTWCVHSAYNICRNMVCTSSADPPDPTLPCPPNRSKPP